MPTTDRPANHNGTPIPRITKIETAEQGQALLEWAFEGVDTLTPLLGIYRCEIALGLSPKEAFNNTTARLLQSVTE